MQKKQRYTASPCDSHSTDGGTAYVLPKVGPGNLPLYGGLKKMTIFKKTGGPHED